MPAYASPAQGEVAQKTEWVVTPQSPSHLPAYRSGLPTSLPE